MAKDTKESRAADIANIKAMIKKGTDDFNKKNKSNVTIKDGDVNPGKNLGKYLHKSKK